MHPKYRSDIDGLRAIAVLSVVFYHAFPEFVRGGFVGVDVFFVISGFLISTIILNGLNADTFSFKDFYTRRIKRIFPALIIVFAACFSIGWAILLPSELAQLGQHMLGGATFVSNFILWNQSGYFDTAAELKPLLHLWSLAIEEQFYIVWPLALYLAWKKQSKLLFFIGITVVASFLLNIYLSYTHSVAAFYLSVARFWELLLGSALAYLTVFRTSVSVSQGCNRFRDIGSLIGLVVIGVTVALVSKKSMFPGWWALLPTFGALMVIASGPNALVNRRILSNRLLVWIGLISYPLYLWHWPLLAFARIFESETPSMALRAGVVALSMLLSFGTYKLIERPIRFSGEGKHKILALASAMGAVALVGLVTIKMNGFDFRFSDKIRQYANFTYDFKTDARSGVCWLSDSDAGSVLPNSCIDESGRGPAKPLVAVWGDSHAARFFPGLRVAASDRFRLAQFTRNSCPPILDYAYENCIEGNQTVLQKINELRPDVVILFAVWNRYPNYASDYVPFTKLDTTVKRLVDIGIPKVLIIGPVPQWQVPLPSHLVNLSRKDFSHVAPQRSNIGLEPAVRAVDAMLATKFSARKGIEYYSALTAMCDQTGCLTRVNDQPNSMTTYDYGHLTTAGGTYLGAKMLDAIGGFVTHK